MIEKPVVIIAAPRSGTTLLWSMLSSSDELWSLYNESRFIFRKFYASHERSFDDDALSPDDCDDSAIEDFRKNFYAYAFNNKYLGYGLQKIIRKNKSLKFLEGAVTRSNVAVKNLIYPKHRLVEKTPRNAFKVALMNKIFPDAKFIYIHRRGESNISSLIEGWRNRSGSGPRLPALTKELNIKGYEGDTWRFVLPPGWQDYSEKNLEDVCAYQWLKSNQEAISALREIPKERVLTLSYEDFTTKTQAQMERVTKFAEIEFSTKLQALAKKLPQVNYLDSKPSAGKWKKNSDLIENVRPIIDKGHALINEFISLN